MDAGTVSAIAGRLAGHGRALEVGVGRRPAVAAALVEDHGVDVTAIDVAERSTPAGVTFRRADVTGLDPAAPWLSGVGIVYGLNLPPELQRPALELAAGLGAACAFTTLGGDPAVVPAEPETVAGATVFWARRDT